MLSKLMKVSTSPVLILGPFLDATTLAPKNDLEIELTDIWVSLITDDTEVGYEYLGFPPDNPPTGDTPEFIRAGEYGYQLVLPVVQRDKLGTIRVRLEMPGCLPFVTEYRVVSANTFNALLGVSGLTAPDNAGIASTALAVQDVAVAVADLSTQVGVVNGKLNLNFQAFFSANEIELTVDGLNNVLSDTNSKLNANFQTFFSANTNDKTVDDMTTPKNVSFSLGD